MAKLKLTELPAVTSRTGADILYIVQNGASKQISTTTLLANIFTAGPGIAIESNGLIVANVSTPFSGTTDDIQEGSANLYFTNTRAIGSLTSGPGVNIAANGLVSADIDYIASSNAIQDLAVSNSQVVFALTAGYGIHIDSNGMISVTGVVLGSNVDGGGLEDPVSQIIDYGNI